MPRGERVSFVPGHRLSRHQRPGGRRGQTRAGEADRADVGAGDRRGRSGRGRLWPSEAPASP